MTSIKLIKKWQKKSCVTQTTKIEHTKIPDTDSSLKPSSESEYNTRKTKNVNLHFTYLPQVAQNESPKISLIPLQSNNSS